MAANNNNGTRAARHIKHLLDATHVTRQELSLATGIPERTLYRRLNTGHGWTLDELTIIAEELNTTPANLINGGQPCAPTPHPSR